MQGKIKVFYKNKGYGFISSLDNSDNDYFFHCSDVITDSLLFKAGTVVSFDIVNYKNREKAVNIIVVEAEQKKQPRFIQINNTFIKIKNIKQFGIGELQVITKDKFREYLISTKFPRSILDKTIEKEWNFYREKTSLSIIIDELSSSIFDNFLFGLVSRHTNLKMYLVSVFEEFGDIYDGKVKYLYITTFQGDNYKFYENKIDIDYYCKLLKNQVN